MNVASLFEICRRNHWRIGVAESCTGGLLGAKLSAPAGASTYFWGGVIAYSNEVKTDILNVNKGTLALNGAVSEEVAREMAMGVCQLLQVELGLAITGVAGPGAQGPKPEGRVCFGIATTSSVTSYTEEFGAIGRENVRHASVKSIIDASISQIA